MMQHTPTIEHRTGWSRAARNPLTFVTVAALLLGVLGVAVWRNAEANLVYGQPVLVSGGSTGIINTMVPTGTGDVQVTVTNPNSFPVHITAINGMGPATSGVAACDNPNNGVSFLGQSMDDTIAAGATQTFVLTGRAAMANVSPDACQNRTFSVPVEVVAASVPVYSFDGFKKPVDNLPVVNRVNAGQAVPLKWRLTLDGVPVSDPSSFVNVQTGSRSCNSNDPIEDVETYPGESSLQYQGDGNWQWNWKTPKAYKGQCRVLYINFADGSQYVANFQFR